MVDGKLPVGAWLYLTFAAPLDEERFTTWGQVVAAYPVPAAGVAGPHVQRLGVRFDGLTPPDRERLGFCLHRYQQYAKAAQTGVAAPPSPVDALDAAYAALCLCPGAPAPVVKAVYRALAHVHHPDVGGDARVMARINAAYAAIQAHLGLPD